MDRMRLSQLHEAYLKDLLALGKSRETYVARIVDFQSLRSYLGQDDTRAFTEEKALGYTAWLSTQGLSQHTVRRRVSGAAMFGRWLTRRKFLPSNPFDNVDRVKEPKSLPRPMPPEYLETLLHRQDIKGRDKAILAVMRYAGLRISEVVNLDLGDVTPQVVVVRMGKGQKDRAIPLNAKAHPYINWWLAERGDQPGPLFLNRYGNRMGRDGIGLMLDYSLKKAGLPRFTPHQLRHTFGTQAARAGVKTRTLQRMMGHGSLNTTQRYVDVTAADIAEAAAMMEQFDRYTDMQIFGPRKDVATHPIKSGG